MRAIDRDIGTWCRSINQGQIKLPRFQRFEAWNRKRICGLLSNIVQAPGLPLGVALVLKVNGKEEPFVSRYLATAEPKNQSESGVVLEHLLDGQQRLTALWRAFHNNYEKETYYVYVEDANQLRDGTASKMPHPFKICVKGIDQWELGNGDSPADSPVVGHQAFSKMGGKFHPPAWCNSPARTLEYGLIPVKLLNPLKQEGEVEKWIDSAVGDEPEDPAQVRCYYRKKTKIGSAIRKLRVRVAGYNLPHLSLLDTTDKHVALKVFQNMNTNSKPLSTYDIVVVQIEDKRGKSLHDMQQELQEHCSGVERYAPPASEMLKSLVLNTSSLLQGFRPDESGASRMDMGKMDENWGYLKRGIKHMSSFLLGERIYDEKRLPTRAVLAVISALYRDIPESGVKLGRDELLLKRYLWYAFFTSRYESGAVPTNALADFNALRRIITGQAKDNGQLYTQGDVPIFAEHSLPNPEALLSAKWPKGNTIRGRAVLAVACRCGARDFNTGEHLAGEDISANYDYHHVFPTALLDKAGIGDRGHCALNCALITKATNRAIGARTPARYIRDCNEGISEDIVRERLQSHLIPYEESSSAGGYDGLGEDERRSRIQKDFEAFLSARAKKIADAAQKLAEGRNIGAGK